MKVTPFNLIFAVLLGYFAVNLLGIRQTTAGSSPSNFSFWHLGWLVIIIVSDIIFRALIADIKRLWLIESLLVVIIAGIVHLIL
ncbi:hypothetical protein [Desertivirga arenae]|uniref:hypothetical protein n=1 Tax=Desertivirga arenae TaxID=2810309 RepID=UPI001A95A5D9|nr:hypothetical protein [Pedobacter sp. SYSU D00823]